jgi:hypothetical protein
MYHSLELCGISLQKVLENSDFSTKKAMKYIILQHFPHLPYSTWRSPCGHLRIAEFRHFRSVKAMTDTQKEKILAMRMQGIGYHVIGRTLHLNENQVQLYCKSRGLAGDGSLVHLNHDVWCRENNRCILCGRKLNQPRLGRRKNFCDGRCRTRYFRLKNNLGG